MAATAGHPASWDVERLAADCELQAVRRSGPGGQRRNKVETGVRLVHRPSGIAVEASELRSREANRRRAFRRLRLRLAVEVRTQTSAETPPSPLWASRVVNGRIRVAESHEDFPSLLAEALDHVRAAGGDLHPAADRLGCTSSQLVRLLKRESLALAQLNSWRSERGLGALR